MALHYARLTDGSTTIDFGGQDSAYQLEHLGPILSPPPIVKITKQHELLRSTVQTIAHAHNNRAAQIHFYIVGTSQDDVHAKVAAVNLLLEKARLADERGQRTYDNSPVWLLIKTANSAKQNWLQVHDGQLTMPSDWMSFSLIQNRVFGCTLDLECSPYVTDGRRPIIEKNGSGAVPVGAVTGYPISALDYGVMPVTPWLSPRFGVVSGWYYNADAASATLTILYSEGAEHLWLHTASSKLTFEGTTNAGPAKSEMAINGTNWGVGWHHLAVCWGTAGSLGQPSGHGWRLFLDGVPATTQDGTISQLATLGRIFIGAKGGVGIESSAGAAYDDVRVSKFWDGIFFPMAASFANVNTLYGWGRDPGSLSRQSNHAVSANGDATHANYADVDDVRGNVSPQLEASINVKTTSGNGTSRLRFANRVSPTAAYKHQVQLANAGSAGTGVTLGTSVTVTADGTVPGGGYLTTASRSSSGIQTTASYNLLLAPEMNGRFRIYGIVRSPNTVSLSFQISLSQTTANYALTSDVKTWGANAWHEIDFGSFNIPIWATPRNSFATVTISLLDNGNSTNPAQWAALRFLPYEDTVPMIVWSFASGQALAQGESVYTDQNGAYRINSTGDFVAAADQPQGRPPQLVPKKTNRLLVTGGQQDNDAIIFTDAYNIYLTLWAQWLGLRE